MGILQAIGGTSLVQLTTVVPNGSAAISVKLEGENPTGSMKDRMAVAVVSAAEADGRLKPGVTMVEYTGGSTGASLAMVCAAKGYSIKLITSDAFSPEKRKQMEAYGAKLILIPSEGGLSTKKLFLKMIETARAMGKEPGMHWNDQLDNLDSIAGYYSLGEEIWEQTGGKVDAFVQSVGTGASLRGVAEVLKLHNPKVRIVAVEPEESSILSGGSPGGHDIEGIGVGFMPPLWDPSLVDEIESVSTLDAKAMARRLAREEAVFAGTSSGANVVASLRVGQRLGPDATVATLMVDSGLKYLNSDIFGSTRIGVAS